MGQTASGLRWKLENTSTTYVHFTYGTADEVRAMCEQRTAAWQRKATLTGRVGSAWRTQIPSRTKKAE